MSKVMGRLAAVLFTAGMSVGSSVAVASAYPDRPIHMVAPIAVGGLTDNLARVLAAGMAERLGQPVIIDNRPGAGGIIGMEAAAKSPADGYTLVFVYQGVAAVNGSLYENLPYDTMRDFTAVAGVGSFPMVLFTRPGLGVSSVEELLQMAREKPGTLNYGSAGNATTSHLSMELFMRETGTDLVHVPYKGEGPANTDIAGDQVDVAFSSLTSVKPLIDGNRVRPLAIGTLESSPLLPDLPTVTDSGVEGFQAVGWYGVLAPKGTPEDRVAKLDRAIQEVLADPAIQKRLQDMGVTAEPRDAKAFHQMLLDEIDKWDAIIQEAGIQVG